MKSLYSWVLLVVAFASCQKKEDPAPALASGTWSLQTQVVTYLPKAGGAVTTRTRPIAPGTITYTYGSDGQYSTVNFGVGFEGAYTYANGVITIPPTTLPILTQGHVFTVTHLSAQQLITVETREDADFRYEDTITYAR